MDDIAAVGNKNLNTSALCVCVCVINLVVYLHKLSSALNIMQMKPMTNENIVHKLHLLHIQLRMCVRVCVCFL